jgi:DNA-binding protein YbaB
MERKQYKLNKRTEEYFSVIQEKIRENADNLESKIYHFEDENKYVGISFNGKHTLFAINISEPLLLKKNAQETTIYLMKFINRAFKNSTMNSIMDMMKLIDPQEFAKIISSDTPEVVNRIKEIENKIRKINLDCIEKRKSAVSGSGNIKIEMAGIGLITSLEMSDQYLSADKKGKIEDELIETINGLLKENIKDITKSIEKIGMEFDEEITMK